MDNRIRPVDLEKAYRLINHGPAVLVSSSHAGTHNVMSASWACALDFSPPKVTVVIDKMTRTRGLIEKSGYFALQVPTVEQVQQVYDVGTQSLSFMPDKLEKSGVELFRIEGHDTPLVAGCSAWLICKLIPEPHNQQTYDLFIGEVVGAWADERAFKDGHWAFETADPRWRSLHYIAGGTFYAIGDLVRVESDEE
ncbi:flavin reductase [Pseudomonas cichorii]|uniref:Flavin reductase-like protein n=1 Tax=Pseudomonas cichorii TaxID=36746 RepID=A0A3M4VY46_PSECI|nr:MULTISPECIES: flavin reductase family protein [Pseudomonas]RMR56685.1 Flavin reductase-like protein [Pseudomonas cichorii]GFM75445.1 flavin reductase [Pseudomonas cichorii]